MKLLAIFSTLLTLTFVFFVFPNLANADLIPSGESPLYKIPNIITLEKPSISSHTQKIQPIISPDISSLPNRLKINLSSEQSPISNIKVFENPHLITMSEPSPGWKFRSNLANTGEYDDGGIRPTKRVLWTFETEYLDLLKDAYGPVISNNIVYISNISMTSALDARTGELKWTINKGTAQTIYYDRLLVVDQDSTSDTSIRTLDINNKELCWEDVFIGYKTPPVVTNGLVIVGSDNGQAGAFGNGIMRAFDLKSGEIKWEFKTEQGYFFVGTPAVSNGKIFAAANGQSGVNNKIYSINILTGIEEWQYNLDFGRFYSSPAISNDILYIGGVTYYQGKPIQTKGTLFAIDTNSHSKIWEYVVGDAIYSSPAISDGVIYFGNDDKKFYGIDIENQEKVFELETGGKIRSSPAISNGIIYFGSNDKKLYAYDVQRNEKLWEFETNNVIRDSPVVANGVVYFRNDDGLLYALGGKKFSDIPVIYSVEPNFGKIGSTLTIKINGANFKTDAKATLVKDNYSIPLTGVRYFSSKTLAGEFSIPKNSLIGEYSVVVTQTGGSSEDTVIFTIQDNCPLSPPVLIEPGVNSAPGEKLSTFTPKFYWNPVDGAEKYGLYISKAPYGKKNIVFDSVKLGIQVQEPPYELPLYYPGTKKPILENGEKYRWDMNSYSQTCEWNTNPNYGFSKEKYFFLEIEKSNPKIISFNAIPRSGTINQEFIISGDVTAGKSATINRIELWRSNKNDRNSLKPYRRDFSSKGLNVAHFQFKDIISISGEYWYGIHVFSNNNLEGKEESSIQVSVSSVGKSDPKVMKFEVSPKVVYPNQKITIMGDASAGTDAEIDHIELWRAETNDPNSLKKYMSDYSMKGKQVSSFLFTDKYHIDGTLLYGIHIYTNTEKEAKEDAPIAISVNPSLKFEITDFKVTPSRGDENAEFQISGYVSAGHGAKLNYVELWRNDQNPNNIFYWKKIDPSFQLTGKSEGEFSFKDSPKKPGTFWYGVHAYKMGSNAFVTELSPLQVTVNSPISTGLSVISFKSDHKTGKPNTRFKIDGSVSAGDGADLKNVKLWISKRNDITYNEIFEEFKITDKRILSFSKDFYSDLDGNYWFYLEVTNMNLESVKSPPIQITINPYENLDVITFDVDPREFFEKEGCKIFGVVSADKGKKLDKVELWRKGPYLIWSKKDTCVKGINGESSAKFEFVDFIDIKGQYQYGIKVYQKGSILPIDEKEPISVKVTEDLPIVKELNGKKAVGNGRILTFSPFGYMNPVEIWGRVEAGNGASLVDVTLYRRDDAQKKESNWRPILIFEGIYQKKDFDKKTGAFEFKDTITPYWQGVTNYGIHVKDSKGRTGFEKAPISFCTPEYSNDCS